MQKEHLCRCPWLDISKEDYVAYRDEEFTSTMIIVFLSSLLLSLHKQDSVGTLF